MALKSLLDHFRNFKLILAILDNNAILGISPPNACQPNPSGDVPWPPQRHQAPSQPENRPKWVAVLHMEITDLNVSNNYTELPQASEEFRLTSCLTLETLAGTRAWTVKLELRCHQSGRPTQWPFLRMSSPRTYEYAAIKTAWDMPQFTRLSLCYQERYGVLLTAFEDTKNVGVNCDGLFVLMTPRCPGSG